MTGNCCRMVLYAASQVFAHFAPPKSCHSERSEESPLVPQPIAEEEILRFAQDDKDPLPRASYRHAVAARCISVVAVALALAGCTRFRPTATARLPGSDRALVHGFIEHVVKRESGLSSVQARTKFTLDSPDLDRRVTFRGFVAFAAPDKLRVQGYSALGIDVFDLVSAGRSFMLRIPSQEKVFFEREGFTVSAVPFTVSPADIALELFRPIEWTEVGPDDVRVARKGADTAVFECTAGEVERAVTVDARWRVTRRERYDTGRLTSTTVLGDYTEVDGIPFPGRIEVIYPAERTYLDMHLSRIRLNGPMDPELFRVPDATEVPVGEAAS